METRPLWDLSLGRSRSARGNRQPAADYHVELSSLGEDPAWDTFLAETSGSHYVQSTAWARLKAPHGWRALRVTIVRGKHIVAGAQLLMRPLPLVGSIGYVPKGPLVADPAPELQRYLLDELHLVARAQRVRYLAVQPARTGHTTVDLLRSQGFEPQPKLGTCPATLLIDLSQDREAILAAMKKRTRANIRRSEARGVVVREGSARDLDTFYHLLVTAGKRKRFPVYSRKYYSALWQAFAPQGQIKLFIAEYAGEAVSAQLAIPFGETLFSHVSAWSGDYADTKPNEALEWAVIMWAKSHGYRYYDFEGLDPGAARAALAGAPLPAAQTPDSDTMVTSYKLGFGGQVVLLPETFDHVYNPLLRWSYRTIYPPLQRWRLTTKARKILNRCLQPPMARADGQAAGSACEEA